MLGKVAKNIAKTALNISAKTVALPLEASIGLAGGITERFTKSFITKYHDVYINSYYAINKFYNYINKRKYYDKEELDYLYKVYCLMVKKIYF